MAYHKMMRRQLDSYTSVYGRVMQAWMYKRAKQKCSSWLIGERSAFDIIIRIATPLDIWTGKINNPVRRVCDDCTPSMCIIASHNKQTEYV